MASPSTLTTSPSATWAPSTATTPLTVTRPSAITSSALRRDQEPLSPRYLLSRIVADPTSAGYHATGLRILLLTPPMIQLNTPYPATAYLTGFLRQHPGLDVRQADPALELFLAVFSREGMTAIAGELAGRAEDTAGDPPPAIAHFL